MTRYGICNLSLIPLRAEPFHKSEMTSQLLFGECFEILEQKEKWSFIKLAYDNYEGWVDTKQIENISSEYYEKVNKETQCITDLSSHAILMKLGHDEMLHLLPGSTLPTMVEEEDLFQIEANEYMFLGLSRTPDVSNLKKEIEEASRFYINTPYLWGGRTLYGIDCSGFSQMIYKHFGIKIPRDAYQQATQGNTIESLNEVLPGDLAFFDNEDGKITHVGIMINDSEIIHASGHVRVDRIDEHGILNSEDQQYTHKLRVIKRLIS